MERTTKTTEKIVRVHKFVITPDDIRSAFKIPSRVPLMVSYFDDDTYSTRYRNLTDIGAEWEEEEIIKES